MLTDSELEQELGLEVLERYSLARFGSVMITEDVLVGRFKPDIMFRQDPDPSLPFSGWVFLSSQEPVEVSPDERGLEFHDSKAIFRVAPEVANYLEMPPGTELVRAGDNLFVPSEP